jgi:predicted GH43/DUF377 family glycosyl hydrolase
MKWKKQGIAFPSRNTESSSTGLAQCPTALVLDDRIRVYYGSRLKDGTGAVFYLDLDKDNPSTIIYTHREPVLSKGIVGAFDHDGVLQVAIKRNKLGLFLYYGGFSKTTKNTHTCMMGVAISKDNGHTFSRISEGPVLPISNVDPFLIGSAEIVLHEDLWHMIYTSGTKWIQIDGKQELSYKLKYANSPDGLIWTPTGVNVIPQKNEHLADCKPAIFKIGDTFHMYFSTRMITEYRDKGVNSYRLGYATSKDLINWTRTDDEGGLSISESGWDSEMICYPNIAIVGDTKYMFYNGNGFGATGFGYAQLL